MQDTRLLNMRESLAEAIRVCTRQVLPLIRDCQELVAQFDDEGIGPLHDRVDMMQASAGLKHAAQHITNAVQAMELVTAECKQMEARG